MRIWTALLVAAVTSLPGTSIKRGGDDAAAQVALPIQNGKVETRAGTSLDRELTALGAGREATWVAWRLPMIDGDRRSCSTWTADGQLQYRGEVLEPSGQAPSIWFQDAEATQDSKEPRQRWHLDVWVAPEAAEGRIDAALAAGGVLVDDRQAPSFVVLADPDGNKACICTALDRR